MHYDKDVKGIVHLKMKNMGNETVDGALLTYIFPYYGSQNIFFCVQEEKTQSEILTYFRCISSLQSSFMVLFCLKQDFGTLKHNVRSCS